MAARTVDLESAKQQLGELVEDALRGHEVVITLGAEPVARLVPYAGAQRKPQFGSAQDLITITEDFDQPIEDFADYTR